MCLCDEDGGFYPKDLTCVDACVGVTCSGNGWCVNVSGLPLCNCDVSYHPDGPGSGCSATRPGKEIPDGGGDGISVARTADGGYVVLGQGPQNVPMNASSFTLIKLSAALEVEWTKQFPLGLFDSATNARPTSDGGYVVLGRYYTPSKMWVMKMDAAGSKLWEKSFTKADLGIVVVQGIDPRRLEVAPDGGFVAAVYPGKIVRLDASGALLWSKDAPAIAVRDVKNALGGGFIVAMPDSLLKVDTDGNQQWSKALLHAKAGYAVVQTQDGGYVHAGSAGTADDNFLLTKVDGLGTFQWDLQIGAIGNDAAVTLDVTTTGEIIAGGQIPSGFSGSFMAKVDSTGKLSWGASYGNEFETCRALVTTPQKGAICVGKGHNTGTWLLQVDENGVPVP
jgi:hypothetical protein